MENLIYCNNCGQKFNLIDFTKEQVIHFAHVHQIDCMKTEIRLIEKALDLFKRNKETEQLVSEYHNSRLLGDEIDIWSNDCFGDIGKDLVEYLRNSNVDYEARQKYLANKLSGVTHDYTDYLVCDGCKIGLLMLPSEDYYQEAFNEFIQNHNSQFYCLDCGGNLRFTKYGEIYCVEENELLMHINYLPGTTGS